VKLLSLYKSESANVKVNFKLNFKIQVLLSNFLIIGNIQLN